MARLQVRSRSRSSMRSLNLAYARLQQPQHYLQALMQHPKTRHHCSHPSFDMGFAEYDDGGVTIRIAQAALRRTNVLVYFLVSLLTPITWSFTTFSIQRMAQALTEYVPSFEYTSFPMTILSLGCLRPKVLYPLFRMTLNGSLRNNECNVAWEGICNFEILDISTLLLPPAYYLESFGMNFYLCLQKFAVKGSLSQFCLIDLQNGRSSISVLVLWVAPILHIS